MPLLRSRCRRNLGGGELGDNFAEREEGMERADRGRRSSPISCILGNRGGRVLLATALLGLVGWAFWLRGCEVGTVAGRWGLSGEGLAGV